MSTEEKFANFWSWVFGFCWVACWVAAPFLTEWWQWFASGTAFAVASHVCTLSEAATRDRRLGILRD